MKINYILSYGRNRSSRPLQKSCAFQLVIKKIRLPNGRTCQSLSTRVVTECTVMSHRHRPVFSAFLCFNLCHHPAGRYTLTREDHVREEHGLNLDQVTGYSEDFPGFLQFSFITSLKQSTTGYFYIFICSPFTILSHSTMYNLCRRKYKVEP
jgi:hypothetical protein